MKKSKPKPIPANVAAIWGAFLYEGMMACSFTKIREQQVLKQWGLGCVELMAGACALLPEVWRQIEPRWYEAQFPGVFEYDVISPLGVSIGDYIILNQGCKLFRTDTTRFLIDKYVLFSQWWKFVLVKFFLTNTVFIYNDFFTADIVQFA